jgi:hypothetical protein
MFCGLDKKNQRKPSPCDIKALNSSSFALVLVAARGKQPGCGSLPGQPLFNKKEKGRR